MNALNAWRWPIYLGATAIAYAPVLPTLAASPQGLRAPALWAALVYLLIAYPLALGLFAWLVRRVVPRRPLPRYFTALVLLPVGLSALFLVPYVPGLLMAFDPIQTLLMGQGLLLTRYLDVCMGAALTSLTWFAFPVVLLGTFLLPGFDGGPPKPRRA